MKRAPNRYYLSDAARLLKADLQRQGDDRHLTVTIAITQRLVKGLILKSRPHPVSIVRKRGPKKGLPPLSPAVLDILMTELPLDATTRGATPKPYVVERSSAVIIQVTISTFAVIHIPHSQSQRNQELSAPVPGAKVRRIVEKV
jgi:hypothetical protein